MYKEGANVDSKIEKNKFESSISELRKKTYVSDIDSYGKFWILFYLNTCFGYSIIFEK